MYSPPVTPPSSPEPKGKKDNGNGQYGYPSPNMSPPKGVSAKQTKTRTISYVKRDGQVVKAVEQLLTKRDENDILLYYQYHPKLRMRRRYKEWLGILNEFYHKKKFKVGTESLRKIILVQTDVKITARFVAAFLRRQLSNQLFNPLKDSSIIGHVRGEFPAHRLQLDTVFFGNKLINSTAGNMNADNKRTAAFQRRMAVGAITCIDVATRHAFALPVVSGKSWEASEVVFGPGGNLGETKVKVKNFPSTWDTADCLIKQVESRFSTKDKKYKVKLISTDKGTEFEGVFKEVADSLNRRDPKNYKHFYSFEGRSASQGIVERFNLTLRRIVNKLVKVRADGAADMSNWNSTLATALKIYNNMVHSTTKIPPALISTDTKSPNYYGVAVTNTKKRWEKDGFTHHKFQRGDFVRLRDFNKSKQKQNISWSWRTTQLSNFIDDNKSIGSSLRKDGEKYRGVHVIQAVHGKTAMDGQAPSYSLVSVWHHEGGKLNQRVPKTHRSVVSDNANVFQGLVYSDKSTMKRFAGGDLQRVPFELKRNTGRGLRKDLPVSAVLRVIDIDMDVEIKEQVGVVEDKRGAGYKASVQRAVKQRAAQKRTVAVKVKKKPADEEYEVEEIVAARTRKRKREVQVKWAGYTLMTWEPEKEFKGLDAYEEFLRRGKDSTQ